MKVVRKFLEFKVDFIVYDEKGDIVFLFVGWFGYVDIVCIFLNFGDDFIYKNNLGYDLWFYVINSNDLFLLKIFLEYGVVLFEWEF